MARRILFVVAEVGSAEYLIPLWRRWLQRSPNASWRVVATRLVAERMTGMGLNGMLLPENAPDRADALALQLGAWRPDVVCASATHAPVEAAAIALARERDIPVVRFIDTWYGYRDRLGSDGRLDVPERVLVIDGEAVRQAVSEGLLRAVLEPVGQPAWEDVVALPPADRRHVMFVSQPVERLFGARLGYTEFSAWQLLYETAVRRPDLISRLVFAPHPEDVMPPPAEDAIVRVAPRGRKDLGGVGTVVGMFSSLMIDALLAGRHVISLQPGAVGPDMNRIGTQRILRATTAEELTEALLAPSIPPDCLRDALKGSCDRLERTLLAIGHD